VGMNIRNWTEEHFVKFIASVISYKPDVQVRILVINSKKNTITNTKSNI